MEEPLKIGPWLIEPQINKVSGPSGSFTIEPRTMKVLVVLAEQKPDVVTREHLLDVVWEGSVVTEHSLTIAISDLRKLFGDDPKSPAVIETIRGVGYRIIAPVSKDTGDMAMSHPIPTLSVPRHSGDGMAMPYTHPKRIYSQGVFWGVAALLLAALFITGALLWPERDNFAISNIEPFTAMAGAEISPAFSPDSRRVAFVAFPDSGGLADIYVKQLDANTPVRLTSEQGAELMPAWSPDGQFIVYLSRGGQGCGLYKRPSFGGAGLKLTDIACQIAGISWAPDGNAIILSLRDNELRAMRIYSFSLLDNQLEPITTPSSSINGDILPRFSPDGQTMAFLRNVDGATQDIHLVDWQSPNAEPYPLAADGVQIAGYDWTADGKAIVFASGREGQRGLWHIDVDNPKEPTLIRAVSVDDPGNLSLAPSGEQLIYTDWTYEVNIWRMPLVGEEASELQPTLVSTRTDFHPHISADNRITFISSRTGTNEVWVSDLAGAHPVQVTDMKSRSTRHPVWSPDGTQIAFNSHLSGHADIYVIDADGGMPVRLTTEESRDVRPTWSQNGKHIYFGSTRTGDWQIWKYSFDGEVISQVTEYGGITGWESMDGHSLYYVRPDSSGVWEKSLSDGSERRLFDADPSFIAYVGGDVYYMQPPQSARSYTIMRYNVDQLDSEQVAVIPIKPFNFFARWGFTVSPNLQWIYVSQIDKSESDLMLTELLP